jgi:hypothetical protein
MPVIRMRYLHGPEELLIGFLAEAVDAVRNGYVRIHDTSGVEQNALKGFPPTWAETREHD